MSLRNEDLILLDVLAYHLAFPGTLAIKAVVES